MKTIFIITLLLTSSIVFSQSILPVEPIPGKIKATVEGEVYLDMPSCDLTLLFKKLNEIQEQIALLNTKIDSLAVKVEEIHSYQRMDTQFRFELRSIMDGLNFDSTLINIYQVPWQ